ncbi:MAG: hypothetical protein AAF581_18525 [Planctomycetota bacterium]
MSRFVRIVSACVFLVCVLGGLALLSLPDKGPKVTAAPGVPRIDDISMVWVTPPELGGVVQVRVDDSAASGDIQLVSVINKTTNTTTSTPKWGPGTKLVVNAAPGDLLVLKVSDNGSPELSDTAVLGFVAASTVDDVPPQLNGGHISSSWGSQVVVTLGIKAFADSSWPGTAELIHDGSVVDSVAVTAHNGGHNTAPYSLTAPAGEPGDRVIVRATDAYGNRTDMHIIVGSSVPVPTTPFFPAVATYRPSGTFCGAERSGSQPVAGDGVHLFGRNFVTDATIYTLKGAGLSVDVKLNYRSTMGYDGPVGLAWDMNLNARMSATATLHRWWPGNGLIWGGFDTNGRAGPGFFWEFDKSGVEWWLTEPNGRKSVFDAQTGLLCRLEDGHYDPVAGTGHAITISRDTTGRILSLRDDRNRVVRFSYFDMNRLAAITDYNGRQVLLDYASDRTLVRVTRADGSYLSWDYDSNRRLTKVYAAAEAANNSPHALISNSYDASGRVLSQRSFFNMHFGNATIFTALPPTNPPAPTPPSGVSAVVRITDPQGNYVDYGHDAVGRTRVVRRHDNHAPTSGPWPGGVPPEPDWVDEHTEYGSNWLPTARYTRHSNQGSNPQDLEREEWVYLSPGTSVWPHLRARVASHTLVGDPLTPSDDITETWSYAGEPWPESHTDLRGVTTTYTHDAYGNVETKKVAAVTAAVTGVQYDIEHRYTYTTDGRPLTMTTPNRAVSTSPHPSKRYTYHAASNPTQHGYLKRIEHLDELGVARLWTEHEYDPLGNLVREENQAGEITEYVYDSLSRLVETRWEEEFTAPGAVATAQPQIARNVFEGDLLKESWHTHYDELGQGGGELVMSRTSVTPTTATSAAKQTSEQRYGLATENKFQKSEKRFDTRGLVTRLREYYDANSYTETNNTYTAAGLVRGTSVDPDRDPAATGDQILYWFSHDHRGRVKEHYETNWTVPRRTYYDAFGFKVREVSTLVVLGREYNENATPTPTFNALEHGYFVTQSSYSVARPTQLAAVAKYAYVGTLPLVEPEDPAFDANLVMTSRERYRYDDAGRRIEVGELLDTNGSTYADTHLSLLPGGQLSRSYLASTGTPTDYTETLYDSLDRVTEEIDATGLNKITTQYSGTTGRVEERDEVVYDERDQSTLTFETGYFYDSRGRVTQVRRYENGGDKATDFLRELIAYDGHGHRIRSVNKDGSAGGVVERLSYDLGGNLLSKFRRYAGAALYAETRYGYDGKGRMIREDVLLNSATNEWATTSNEFDDADRLVKVTHPPYLSAARVTEYAHSFSSYHGSIGLPTVLETQPTLATGLTVRNQFGNELATTVTYASTVEGPTLVEFAYGGAAACGCVSNGKAVEARSFAGDGLTAPAVGDNIVRRTYDDRGNVATETSLVWDGDSWQTDTLSFSTDERGRPEQVVFPGSGTTVTILDREFRADGVLTEMRRTPAGSTASATIMEYQYVGRSPRWQTSKDGALPTQAIISEGGMSYDGYFRHTGMEWDNRGSGDYQDQYTGLTADGMPTTRLRDGSFSDVYDYSGDNWLTTKTIDVGGANSPSTAYTRNNIGRLLVRQVDGGGTDFNDWTYGYGGEFGVAGLNTSISGKRRISREFEKVVDNFPNDVYITRDVSDRSFQYDASGRAYRGEFDFDATLSVSAGGFDFAHGTPYAYHYDLRVLETEAYDFWGRRIRWSRTTDSASSTRTRYWADSQTGQNTGPEESYDLPELEKLYYYDALGRVALQTVDGQYFAYLDSEAAFLPNSSMSYVHRPVDHISIDLPEQTYFHYGPVGTALLKEFDNVGASPTLRVARQLYNNPTTNRADKGQNSLFSVLYGLDGEIVGGNAGSCIGSGPGGEEGDISSAYFDLDGTVLQEGEQMGCLGVFGGAYALWLAGGYAILKDEDEDSDDLPVLVDDGCKLTMSPDQETDTVIDHWGQDKRLLGRGDYWADEQWEVEGKLDFRRSDPKSIFVRASLRSYGLEGHWYGTWTETVSAAMYMQARCNKYCKVEYVQNRKESPWPDTSKPRTRNGEIVQVGVGVIGRDQPGSDEKGILVSHSFTATYQGLVSTGVRGGGGLGFKGVSVSFSVSAQARKPQHLIRTDSDDVTFSCDPVKEQD